MEKIFGYVFTDIFLFVYGALFLFKFSKLGEIFNARKCNLVLLRGPSLCTPFFGIKLLATVLWDALNFLLESFMEWIIFWWRMPWSGIRNNIWTKRMNCCQKITLKLWF